MDISYVSTAQHVLRVCTRLARLVSFSSRFSSACDRFRKLVSSEMENSRSFTIVDEAGSRWRDECPETSFTTLSPTEIAVVSISEQWMTCRAVSCMYSKLRFSDASSDSRVFSKSLTTSLQDHTARSKFSTIRMITNACREKGPCPHLAASPARRVSAICSCRLVGTSKQSITRPRCGLQLLAKASFSQR